MIKNLNEAINMILTIGIFYYLMNDVFKINPFDFHVKENFVLPFINLVKNTIFNTKIDQFTQKKSAKTKIKSKKVPKNNKIDQTAMKEEMSNHLNNIIEHYDQQIEDEDNEVNEVDEVDEVDEVNEENEVYEINEDNVVDNVSNNVLDNDCSNANIAYINSNYKPNGRVEMVIDYTTRDSSTIKDLVETKLNVGEPIQTKKDCITSEPLYFTDPNSKLFTPTNITAYKNDPGPNGGSGIIGSDSSVIGYASV